MLSSYYPRAVLQTTFLLHQSNCPAASFWWKGQMCIQLFRSSTSIIIIFNKILFLFDDPFIFPQYYMYKTAGTIVNHPLQCNIIIFSKFL